MSVVGQASLDLEKARNQKMMEFLDLPSHIDPDSKGKIVLCTEEDWGCLDFIQVCYGLKHAKTTLEKCLVPKVREEDVVWTARRGSYGEEALDIIGSGECGVVYRAVLRDNQGRKTQVVVKQNKKRYPDEKILREAQILRLLRDTCYVPYLHGLVLGCDKSLHRGLGLVQSIFGDGVTLISVLRDVEKLPLQHRPYVAWHLAVGLKAIHDRGVLINDLHTDNVLLDLNSYRPVRYIDFGFASFGSVDNAFNGTHTEGCVHLAPEIQDGQPVTPESDVYSLGIVIEKLIKSVDGYEPAPLMKEAKRRCLDEDPRKRDLGKIIFMLDKCL